MTVGEKWTLVLVGTWLAMACGGSDGTGAPGGTAGTRGDASVESGGQSGSTGGRSAGGASTSSGGAGTGGSATNSGGVTPNSGGSPQGSGGATGGTDAGSGGAAGAAGGGNGCGGRPCAPPGEVCIAHRTVGGGVIVPDAGRCPAGSHVEPFGPTGSHCAADYGYECVDLVGCNPGSISCSCGRAICPSRYPACSEPNPNRAGLDPVAQLVCELQAP